MERGVVITNLWILFVVLGSRFSFVSGINFTDPVYSKSTFPYTKCKQTADGVHCEPASITEDAQESISVWPPGPYALRILQNDGCPEWQSRGWRKGFLEVTAPNASRSMMFYFCSKIRNNPNFDKGKWMTGTYRIFRFGETCPKEFDELDSVLMSLEFGGTVSSAGYLPRYDVINDTGSHGISFKLCVRIITDRYEGLPYYGMLETAFRVEKEVNTDCPSFEEVSTVEPFVDNVTGQAYCAYTPTESLEEAEFELTHRDTRRKWELMRFLQSEGIIKHMYGMKDEIHTLIVDMLTVKPVHQINFDVRRINRSSSKWRFRFLHCFYDSVDSSFDDAHAASCGQNYTALEEGMFIINTGKIHARYIELLFRYNYYYNGREIVGRHKDDVTVYGYGHELLSDISMATGSGGIPEVDELGLDYTWIQLDLKRHLAVINVYIEFQTKSDNPGKYIQCFYADVKWSFLHHGAHSCGNDSISHRQRWMVLLNRKTHARYITLVFEERNKYPKILKKEWLKIFASDFPEVCNEDIGMTDFTILDLQLTASSWLQGHPPSAARPFENGWRPKATDTQPWILNFDFNFKRPVLEGHSFILVNHVKARYVKLEFQSDLAARNDCLTFELHGCKLVGGLSLNCPNESMMVRTKYAITTERKAMMIKDVRSEESCNASCLGSANCSIARFNETCVHYPPSLYGIWQLGDTGDGSTFAKLCQTEPVHLFPSLRDVNGSIGTNIATVQTNSIITSVGYPFSYRSAEQLIWIVTFPAQRYVRLVFTDIVLTYSHQNCYDWISLSTRFYTGERVVRIDHNYNGRYFIIETAESLLVVTLHTCIERIGQVGPRFRAVITGESIPPCYQTNMEMVSGETADGMCLKQEMSLASLSALNLPYQDVLEKWTIQAQELSQIVVHVLYFYVVCPTVCSQSFGKCYHVFHGNNTWHEADNACRSCNLEIVSAESQPELNFINYLLRERLYRYDEYQLKLYELDVFLAQIGFRQLGNEFAWTSGASSTYSAWREGHPKIGNNCAVTQFALFQNDSLQSEQCTVDKARYYVCQSSQIKEETNNELCTCKNGWIQNRNKCILFSDHIATWGDSVKFCQESNSHIVDYIDLDEVDLFGSTITKRGCSVHWTGLSNSNTWQRSVYSWLFSGISVSSLQHYLMASSFTLSYWNSNEYCAALGPDGYFHLVTCSYREHFICVGNLETRSSDACSDVVWSRPTINVTHTGDGCQDWTSLTSGAQSDFKSRFPHTEIPSSYSSYCEDPSSSGLLWCYTNTEDSWDTCFISSTMNLSSQDNYTNQTNEMTYRCEDETYVPISARCNGIFDCADFSDEMFCHTKAQYLTNDGNLFDQDTSSEGQDNYVNYLCGSKEWISVYAVCDDVIHCFDASDETDCLDKNNDTKQNISACDAESCLSEVCSFEAVDQFIAIQLECTEGEFMCGTGACISLEEMCNGVPDCVDRSDETQCESCKDSLHCDKVNCIAQKYICDNFVDCNDRADEYMCDYETPKSCEHLWDLEYGGIVSGQYNIDNLTIMCDFSSMPDEIRMSVRNIDIDNDNNIGYLYTSLITGDILLIKDKRFQTVVYQQNYTCTLEVKSYCHLHDAIKEYLYAFPGCGCIINTYDIGLPYGHINKSNTDIGPIQENKNIQINSSECDGFRIKDVRSNTKFYDYITHNGGIHISEEEFDVGIPTVVAPEINCVGRLQSHSSKGKTGTDANCVRCIYNGEEARCGRDHLENCADFQCPKNTVKCVNTFCIPLHFVCNLKADCPYGTDELGCYCSNSPREVYILVEETTASTEGGKAAVDLAMLFYNALSDIRILYYTIKTSSDLFIFNLDENLLDIKERRFRPFKEENSSTECHYTLMARNFLSGLKVDAQVTNGTKAVVFIQHTTASAEIAELVFGNVVRSASILYRVLQENTFQMTKKYTNTYNFVEDIYVKAWSSLFASGNRRFNQLCKDDTIIPCEGRFRCSNSKQCIPLEQICDSIAQCIHGDDETVCDIFCPRACTCSGYSVKCRAVQLTYEDTRALSRRTKRADLSMNPDLQNVLNNERLVFPTMTTLNLSSCEIKRISDTGFQSLTNLQCLDIGYNEIEELVNDEFRLLKDLVYLNIDGNVQLRTISPTIFSGLNKLNSIRMTGTNIKRIYSNMFNGLTLKLVDITYNKIEEIEDYAFNNTHVGEIDFRGNDIKKFNRHIFDGISSLSKLRATAFKFCCVRPCNIAENECYPPRDEFSSCEDLMRHPVLQAVLWLIGLTAFIGNISSVLYRIIYDQKRLQIGYGIFVTNLAVADCLMGVYLLIIAVADTAYRNRYIFVDDEWRNSIWCVTAGVLSTVSSEASVFILCLITLDRFLVIKYPFGTMKITKRAAHICCIVCWLLAVLLAIIPVVFTSVFKGTFYSKSGVCVALPLTADKPPGWVYPVIVYIGLNLLTVVLVAVGQLSIFLEIRKAGKRVQKSQQSRKRDFRVARNLILVATTDFLCWFPIGIIGIVALSGYPISGDVYAWTAVFVLPFNSALNPVLYTLSTVIGKESFNLSIEEQEKIAIKKEVGCGLIEFTELLKSMRQRKRKGPYISLDDMIASDGSVSIATAVTTSTYLSRCMRLLHESWTCIDRLSLDSIYVKEKRGKVVGILIDSKMSATNDEVDMQNNMQQFGIILRRLLATYREEI